MPPFEADLPFFLVTASPFLFHARQRGAQRLSRTRIKLSAGVKAGERRMSAGENAFSAFSDALIVATMTTTESTRRAEKRRVRRVITHLSGTKPALRRFGKTCLMLSLLRGIIKRGSSEGAARFLCAGKSSSVPAFDKTSARCRFRLTLRGFCDDY